MSTGPRVVRRAQLHARVQRLTREIEELVRELEAALGDGYDARMLASAARSLERAASAVRAVVERASPGALPDELRAILEGTSPVLSAIGSRVVLARTGKRARPPSIGAQALAVLLEDPERTFDASEIAARLGCSVPIARTALHRLVRSGHATRPAAGRFRAGSR